MFNWFRKFCKIIYLSDLKGADTVFVELANNIKTLRGQLAQVYEETELAIRALDVLGERVDEARSRIKDRVTHNDKLKPREFTLSDRQRT